jgi:hypothetical protein
MAIFRDSALCGCNLALCWDTRFTHRPRYLWNVDIFHIPLRGWFDRVLEAAGKFKFLFHWRQLFYLKLLPLVIWVNFLNIFFLQRDSICNIKVRREYWRICFRLIQIIHPILRSNLEELAHYIIGALHWHRQFLRIIVDVVVDDLILEPRWFLFSTFHLRGIVVHLS